MFARAMARQRWRRIAQHMRFFASGSSKPRIPVTLVEVGPRDGLQNERGEVTVDVKVELVDRLGRAGLQAIEVGSFVSPRWVPQMAGTTEVITRMRHLPKVRYPVLIPNQRGLDDLLALLPTFAASGSQAAPAFEVSVFTGATDAFTQANLNTPTTAQSLQAIEPVVQRARAHGLPVRGYVSVVVACPYTGRVDPARVRDVARALVDMGCFQVSLGDTLGAGNPTSVSELLDVVARDVSMDKLAGHFHDTYGMGVANVLTALSLGIRTIDTSVGGLGGCPYAPGATGNVATEDVLYALRGSPYRVTRADDSEREVDVEEVALIGRWISETLGRGTESKVGKAITHSRRR